MQQPVYVPLTSDYGFKATFGKETDTLFLCTTLQALLKSDVPITSITFEKSTFEALTIDSRSGIFDIACTDANGTHFIVEMQLGYAPHFVQRMKFYALHKFNTLVERGEFEYAKLPKIYAIAFVEKKLLPTSDYHTIANLRNEQGELIDRQMSFIIVELAKFAKPLEEITTNLDKLIYTMKTLHTTEPTQYPAFWNEEWLRRAIDELDTRKMTPEERAYFARVTAANAEAVNAEKHKIREAREDTELVVKTETVKKMLSASQLSVEDIAEFSSTSVDFVLAIKQNLQTGK